MRNIFSSIVLATFLIMTEMISCMSKPSDESIDLICKSLIGKKIVTNKSNEASITPKIAKVMAHSDYYHYRRLLSSAANANSVPESPTWVKLTLSLKNTSHELLALRDYRASLIETLGEPVVTELDSKIDRQDDLVTKSRVVIDDKFGTISDFDVQKP